MAAPRLRRSWDQELFHDLAGGRTFWHVGFHHVCRHVAVVPELPPPSPKAHVQVTGPGTPPVVVLVNVIILPGHTDVSSAENDMVGAG